MNKRSGKKGDPSFPIMDGLSDWKEMAYGKRISFHIEHRSKGGKEGESTGKFVPAQIQLLQFYRLPQFSRDGTWGIQNTVKAYNKQVTLPD
jgi:hypothetical protein